MTGCGTERYADWFFDLDGTLVDSAPDILRLLGGVLREEGLAVPELDKGRIGPLLEDIIRGICPDLAPADLERIVSIYRARYRACPFDKSPAFPGIPPLFERLSAAELAWLVGGGLAYTLGAVVFHFDWKLRYGHFVWHLFVLAGTACHVVAVLLQTG